MTEAICLECGATLTDAERDAGDACADCSAEPPREIVIVIPGEAKTERKRQRFVPGRGNCGKRTDEPDRADWKAWARLCAAQVCNEPLRGPLVCDILVRKPKPDSWPKRATKANPWPWAWWKKPDIGNFEKIISDAMTGIVWVDDAQVIDQRERKHFGPRDEVIVTVRPATEADLD